MSESLAVQVGVQLHKTVSAPQAPVQTHLPGDPLIWLFVVGDMVVFTLFFCVYGYFRTKNTALYQSSQAVLNMHYGAVNSLILLVSSWLMVLSLNAARRGEGRLASHFIGGAFVCGVAFSVAKVMEYQAKLAAGIEVATNPFFTFYYLLTGLHFAHLLCGLCVLAWFYPPLLRGRVPTEEDIGNLESTAVYWHMVDLLWIVIFTLLYLLP